MEAGQVQKQEQESSFPPIGKQVPGFNREKRENLFRDLSNSEWTTGKTIGVIAALLFGLGFLASGGVGILIGLALLGGTAWILFLRQGKDLDAVPVAEIEKERDTAAEISRADAVDVLRLDPDDVVQSVTLSGPTLRPNDQEAIGLIEGRTRDIQGKIKPYPMQRWVPWAVHGDKAVFGRYQIHNVFALEDGIAYHTKHYDVIDGEFAPRFYDNNEWNSDYATNKIYYRKIENVKMTQDYLELQMDSGRSHVFGLRIPRETAAQTGGAKTAGGSAELAAVDQAMFEEGKAFERAVNELRDQFERGQAAR